MDQNVIIGLGYAVIAGVFAGSFSLPMKFTKDWKWQHNWMVYTVWSTLLMPIIFAIFTVPQLGTIYHSTDILVFLKVVSFGMAWGIGSVCFGLGLEYLGVALGMSIMLGLIISIGTLIPIIVYQPNELTSPKGIKIIIASIILIVGIIIIAIAGSMRDRKMKNQSQSSSGKSLFRKGLLIAILAGVLGPMLNIAFINGNSIKDIAIKLGTNPSYAGNAVWPIALFGGFLINFAYCAYLIRKNNEWSLFKTKRIWYWLVLAISGIVWFFCMMFYGMSVEKLGKLGASIGWASFQSLAIITGNFVGLFTGEWKKSGSKPLIINFVGIAILLVGIYVIAF